MKNEMDVDEKKMKCVIYISSLLISLNFKLLGYKIKRI